MRSVDDSARGKKDSFEIHFKSLRIGGAGEPDLFGDDTLTDEAVEIVVEGLRPKLPARFNDGGDFFRSCRL